MIALWLVTRPVVDRRRNAGWRPRATPATSSMRHGAGHPRLLRPAGDKHCSSTATAWWPTPSSAGSASSSPDPIGPADGAEQVWSTFRRFADSRGLVVTVMGATERMAADLPLGRHARLLHRRRGGRHVRRSPGRWPHEGSAPGVQPDRPATATRCRSTTRAQLDPRPGGQRGLMDTEPPGRGRAGLLDDARPPLRPRPGRRSCPRRWDRRGPPAAFCQFVPAPASAGTRST